MSRSNEADINAEVRNNPTDYRYELWADGELAGYAKYALLRGRIAFLHTEIDPSLEGRGLGSRLMGSALDEVRERRFEVLPFCPFVNEFIRRHRDEYVELVPERYRQGFGL